MAKEYDEDGSLCIVVETPMQVLIGEKKIKRQEVRQERVCDGDDFEKKKIF